MWYSYVVVVVVFFIYIGLERAWDLVSLHFLQMRSSGQRDLGCQRYWMLWDPIKLLVQFPYLATCLHRLMFLLPDVPITYTGTTTIIFLSSSKLHILNIHHILWHLEQNSSYKHLKSKPHYHKKKVTSG